MWNLLTESLRNGNWISLVDFGYAGIIRVLSIKHEGRTWNVTIESYGGRKATLRVGKVKVLEIL